MTLEAYQQLEKDWAEFNSIDPKGMVVCSSGTAALHLALEALQLPLGSKVILPDYTMIACARAVTLAGHQPVFVDCCPDDLLMDTSILARALLPLVPDIKLRFAPSIRAIMTVAVYGRRNEQDMTYIADIRRNVGIPVIEDLAEAHGIPPSNCTDVACWSFYKNKIITGEEGGAVWFRDPLQADLARSLRSLGFQDYQDYKHIPRGHNYRMSNCHAKLILESMKSYCNNCHHREAIVGWYDSLCPPAWKMPERQANWVYDLRIPHLMMGEGYYPIDTVVGALNRAGIAARNGFKPLHRQQEYRDKVMMFKSLNSVAVKQDGLHSESHKASLQVLYLPIQPGKTTQNDARKAFDTIHRELATLVDS